MSLEGDHAPGTPLGRRSPECVSCAQHGEQCMLADTRSNRGHVRSTWGIDLRSGVRLMQIRCNAHHRVGSCWSTASWGFCCTAVGGANDQPQTTGEGWRCSGCDAAASGHDGMDRCGWAGSAGGVTHAAAASPVLAACLIQLHFLRGYRKEPAQAVPSPICCVVRLEAGLQREEAAQPATFVACGDVPSGSCRRSSAARSPAKPVLASGLRGHGICFHASRL